MVIGRHRTDKPNGFSLFELLVVMAIIGIASVVALVSIRDYRDTIQANAAMRQVAGDLRVARAKAIRKHRIVLVRFHNSGGNWDKYSICDGDENFTEEICHYHDLPPRIVFGTPTEGVTLGAAGAVSNAFDAITIHRTGYAADQSGSLRQFYFKPNGSANFNVVIYMTPTTEIGQAPENTRAVDVRQISGAIRAWKFSNGGWR